MDQGMPSGASEPVRERRIGRPPRGEAPILGGRIVLCASNLFLERGYSATSIEAVAAEAGVGKNTIYRRYATKSELFKAVVDYQMRTLLPPLDALDLDDDPMEALRHLALTLVTASLKPETIALQRLVIAEALRFPEMAAIYIKHAYERATGIVEQVLARAGLAGKNAAEANFAAEEFIACLIYVPHTYALLGDFRLVTDIHVARHVDQALALFLTGYGKR